MLRMTYMPGFSAAVPFVMADVWRRLALARQPNVEDSAKKAYLASSIYGYFVSMPFQRGSSAIGRSFWSGVSSFIIGKKIVLPDAVDLHAIVRGQEDFEEWILKFL